MIAYHGTPITPEDVAVRALAGRHGFVSFANPEQLGTVATVCSSFAADNGAFSMWTAGRETDWLAYYAWCAELMALPGLDFAVVPDSVEGGEAENDALAAEWPYPKHVGAVVWHLHESLDRLAKLAADWPRVCLGSSGKYSDPGSPTWWNRIAQAMEVLCDSEGRPRVKIHGLRMLDPAIFSRVPFASADSTNVARNIGLDTRWAGSVYQPRSKNGRAAVLIDRIESVQGATRWAGRPVQNDLFGRVA